MKKKFLLLIVLLFGVAFYIIARKIIKKFLQILYLLEILLCIAVKNI